MLIGKNVLSTMSMFNMGKYCLYNLQLVGTFNCQYIQYIKSECRHYDYISSDAH